MLYGAHFCCGFLRPTFLVVFRDLGIGNVRLGFGINYKLNPPFSVRFIPEVGGIYFATTLGMRETRLWMRVLVS
jgi:hypothetical protein